MKPTGTRIEMEKFDGTEPLGLWQTRMEILLAQHVCLKVLPEVMSAKMELSCDGCKYAKEDLGASSMSYSRTSSAGSD